MTAAGGVVLTGGGTGGHVYPALAVADALRRLRPDLPLLYVGTAEGMEARLVPPTGLPWAAIAAAGFRGKSVLDRLRFPLAVWRGTVQARGLLRRHRPRLVVGTGGYVSLPVLLAARSRRIPFVLQEQNAVPGATNRLLAPAARRVFLGFPEAAARLRGASTRVTGNPVRAAVAAVGERAYRPPPPDGPCRVLVFGGSRGARTLNRAVAAAAAAWAGERDLVVEAQTGPEERAAVAAACREAGAGNVTVVPYIEDMAAAYARAHLVVCRAGAMTTAELAAAGRPAILVPFPHAVGDHQTHNARGLAAAGAAVLVPDAELDGPRLVREVARLRRRPDRLAAMAAAARARYRGDAATAIAREVLALLDDGPAA